MAVEQILAANAKAMSFEPRKVNYSINLGLPVPAQKSYYEFAIVGQQNEKREAIPKLLKVFEGSSATVISVAFWNERSADRFIMNVICDLSSAKCPPDELLIRINKCKFVSVAEMAGLDGRVFGKYTFPLTFFGEVRALAMDADRFVHLFDDITKTFGKEAKEALFENGRVEGQEIVDALKEILGEKSNNRELLLENALAFFQAAGWGRLFFYKEGVDLYKLVVNDPPCDANDGAILGNYFLQGLVAGMIERFLSGAVRLSMIREGYDEQSKALILYYMDKRSLKELSAEEEEKSVDDTADQVKQIIKSIDQIKDRKENEEEIVPVVVSDRATPASRPMHGELVGSGIQIMEQTERPPLPRRRKKTDSSPSSGAA